MKISDAKVLVTGGAGFIGSNIVESLLELGANVGVYDDFSFGFEDNLTPFKKDIEIIRGDILDYESLSKAFKGYDLISHHAAQLEIFLCVDDPYRDLQVNTVGTLNVLRAAKERNVKKVINASSACIYGQTNKATTEESLPVPNWAYGVSKLAAERYATIYNNYENVPAVSLRYGITYGEREWYRRVLTIFIKRAILKQPLVIFGKGDQIRDFVYVKDAVRLHNLCIEKENANGQSYNVATNCPTTINELAEAVAEVAADVLGFRPDIIHEQTEEGEFSKLVVDKKRNPAELKTMLLDVSKAKNELGWEPEVMFREGIANEMRWCLENLDRWQKVHYTKTDK